jgi:hypothetical protein
VGYLRVVHRVSNEIVWAGVAAIVAGVLIASFVGGSGAPSWILVAVVVGLGFVVTSVRTRRDARALRQHYAAGQREILQPTSARRTGTVRRVEPSAHATNGPASESTSVRRAGARSESLGAKPRRGQKPPR